MGDARNDDTQLVCTTEPVCLCAGEEYSCDCTPDERGARCTSCEAMLKLIDADNGDDVPAHRFEEAHDDPAPAPNCWDCGQARGHVIHVADATSLVVARARLAAQGTEESDG